MKSLCKNVKIQIILILITILFTPQSYSFENIQDFHEIYQNTQNNTIDKNNKQQNANQDQYQSKQQYNQWLNQHQLKFLQIERQIEMTKQMIKLYNQRLQILQQLHQIKEKQLKEIQKIQTLNKKDKSSVQSKIKIKDKKRNINKDSLQQSDQFKLQNSLSYVLMREHIHQQKENTIISPPFIINLSKGVIQIINGEKLSGYIFSPYKYIFHQVAQFYKNPQQKYKSHQRNNQITLTLENIQSKKISKVKLTYIVQNNIGRFQHKEELLDNKYHTNENIYSNSQWHYSVDYQDAIVGYKSHIIYIKDHSHEIHTLSLQSQVIALFSINQYKIFFVSAKSYGIINVRSYSITQQTKLEHYLGNRSKLQKNKVNVIDQVYQKQKKQWQLLSAISCIRQSLTSFNILLSNGLLLYYSNDKIMSSFVLSQFCQTFYIPSYLQKYISFKMKFIYPYLFVYSNRHSNVALYNISASGMIFWKNLQFRKGELSRYTQYQYHFLYQNAEYVLYCRIKQEMLNQQDLKTLTYQYTALYQYHLLIQPKIQHHQSTSYFWNFLMIIVVVIGVLAFRKFRNKPITDDQKQLLQQDLLQKQNILNNKNKKRKLSTSNIKDSLIKNKMHLNEKTINEKSLKTTSDKQFQQMQQVIKQLQTYFLSQGQKLTRQQILQMVSQYEDNQINSKHNKSNKISQIKIEQNNSIRQFLPNNRRENDQKSINKNSQVAKKTK